MQLDKVKSLPKKLLENIDEVERLSVYLVQDYSNQFLRRLVDFGENIFGELGMDEWGLVPQIRHGNVYVLKEEDKKPIFGLAILMRDWEDADKVYLFDYAIIEALQGKKLGYNFLKVIVRNIKEQGFKRMGLTVDIENEPAINLYKKIGFKILEMSEDEYGKSHDRYIMELEFDGVNF
ncbi:GNAT family N-acetyltransferase [Sedimentibacter sp. MB31-C6]|uniref:GNAT family N-acetyltransferase n=1 Tax=Sedimentibacter sp. MB31-C6 TaxID=3109366 RepID=UPI002DDD9E4B|nr:GNAT family N-acetyltransferase [Sedimentibacter sp. MB36-C1]WSI05523.1 GNAT family N-acetyltransferase [Sedimentibacter sp. MB36-C1]